MHEAWVTQGTPTSSALIYRLSMTSVKTLSKTFDVGGESLMDLSFLFETPVPDYLAETTAFIVIQRHSSPLLINEEHCAERCGFS
jgi:hypothetical protein